MRSGAHHSIPKECKTRELGGFILCGVTQVFWREIHPGFRSEQSRTAICFPGVVCNVRGENCNMADDVMSIESHQSFGESESDTNTKSGKWDSQVREKSIMMKSIIKTTTKPRVNPSHTPTPEKRRKAIKFGKIEWYN